jgi:hypothetical protein
VSPLTSGDGYFSYSWNSLNTKRSKIKYIITLQKGFKIIGNSIFLSGKSSQ